MSISRCTLAPWAEPGFGPSDPASRGTPAACSAPTPVEDDGPHGVGQRRPTEAAPQVAALRRGQKRGGARVGGQLGPAPHAQDGLGDGEGGE